MKNIAINGLGRIGRLILRRYLDGGYASVFEGVDQAMFVEGVEIADVDGAALHHADFFKLRFT